MEKQTQGLQLPGLTKAGEMGKDVCVGGSLGAALWGVLIPVSGLTGSVSLSKPA